MDRYKILSHMGAGAHGVILKGTYTSVLDRAKRVASSSSTTSTNSVGGRASSVKGGIAGAADDDDDYQDNLDIPNKYLLAIKRIIIRNKTIPLSIVREIKCLQYLRSHDNIILLEDVFALGSSVNLVFPLLPINLTTIIYEMPGELGDSQCQIYIRQLLSGVHHCHTNGIVHRDLKPSNLLVDWSGVLKICDFGQARTLTTTTTSTPNTDCGQFATADDDDLKKDHYHHHQQCDSGNASSGSARSLDNPVLSHQVCTRWYRCPELLYGSNSYDYTIDMWSVGCIIGELIQRWPLFKGESDIEQLCLVVKTLGAPPADWTNSMPDFNKIQFTVTTDHQTASRQWLRKLERKCRTQTLAADLVTKLCTYTDRLDSYAAIGHPYLANNSCSSVVNNDSLLIKPQFIMHLVGPPMNRKPL